jgi:UDP-N-acetylmuramyl pentapeptide phosphotransferase/UDP-N-acetylglucosamine-1-phosphate transferase
MEWALALAVLGFALSSWLTYRFCHPGSWVYVLDHPNERSLHSRPTPRTGGIAIVVAVVTTGSVFICLIGARWQSFVWFGSAILLVATVSFLDDRRSIGVGYRMVMHTLASAVLAYSGLAVDSIGLPGTTWTLTLAMSALVAIFYLVWMLNLFNFMDGMDGLAGGMTVIGFGTYALLGSFAGHELFAGLSLLVACAGGGFLLFNFPPARIFMGDVGSSVLGLLSGSFSLWGARDGIFPLWAAVLIFSPFIADATVTLIRRILKGEKFWKPHKTHFYQKLILAGWGHQKTLVVEYGIMLACGISALVSVDASATVQVVVLSVWVLFYIIFFSWISRISSKQRS